MATNAIIEKVNSTDGGVNRIASTFYCTCSTAADTAQKDATPADSCVFNDNCLITGVTVFVKFTYTNTHATPTLKVGTATAKQIMAYGTTKIGTSTTKSWYAGSVVSFTYDGTYWIQNDYKFDTDNNDISTIRPYYTHFKSSANGIKQYSLFAKVQDSDTYTSFTSTHGTGTKTYLTNVRFDLSDIYYFNSSSNLAANTNAGNNTVTNCVNLVDMRYTLNGVTTSASTSSLVANKPVYLVFDENCQLYSPYFVQDPATYTFSSDEENHIKFFVLLGYMYDSYRMDLIVNNPLYEIILWEVDPSTGTSRPVVEPIGFNKTWYNIKDTPTTLSGYGITDAKIASGIITLGSNTITPLTSASTLDATKLSGTIPSGCYTDTKNTAGSTDTASKIFLVGATSQAANPQTYSQDTAYVDTNGHVYSNSKQVVNLSDTQALTNKTYNGYTLAAACAKAVVTSVDTSASLPTSNAVKTFVEGKGYVTTDTKNTAGSTDTSSKIYLIGATSQAANPQTYSDNEVYATSGVLTTKSVQIGGGAATMQYNSTTQSIDFIFS